MKNYRKMVFVTFRLLTCVTILALTGCAKDVKTTPSGNASSIPPAISITQNSAVDDVRKAVIQATPAIAASLNGTTYEVKSLDPEVEVSLTSPTEAKCRLITKLGPTATLKSLFSVNLTKYDTGWRVDDYKYIDIVQ